MDPTNKNHFFFYYQTLRYVAAGELYPQPRYQTPSKLGVSKFCSVRFLPEKNSQTEKKKKKRPETELEPAQTGRFRSGFGPVFYPKNRTNL